MDFINLKRKPILFVISGPSGVGKSTLCQHLLSNFPKLKFSVSTTTRPKRRGEIEGKDYFFTDKVTFEKMIKEDRFLEWAMVHDNYYGTSKKMVEDLQNNGYDVLLEIDVQGGLSIKKQRPKNASLVFIAPPHFKDLEKRLFKRATDTEEVIRKRIENARKELKYVTQYDYLLVNNDLNKAIQKIEAIYLADTMRLHRYSFENFKF
jgi:guanylate kinase